MQLLVVFEQGRPCVRQQNTNAVATRIYTTPTRQLRTIARAQIQFWGSASDERRLGAARAWLWHSPAQEYGDLHVYRPRRALAQGLYGHARIPWAGLHTVHDR